MSLVRFNDPELTTWAPTDRLSSIREEMNRLFDLSFPGFQRDAELFSGWSPTLDVFQNDDNVTVKVELPGMKKEDISIALHDGILTISGERKFEEQSGTGENFRSERFFGKFHRSVALPTAVDAAKVKASYKDGILEVTLPKSEEAKPKKIEVNVA